MLRGKRGEIATTLTLIAIGIMTVGAFVGSRLAQQNADIRSRAETPCVLSANPTLLPKQSGKPGDAYCRVYASKTSPDLVCALIDEKTSARGDEVLIAGQDPADWNGVWNGSTADVPLFYKDGQSINSSITTYKLVVWDYRDPGSIDNPSTYCARTTDISGSDAANKFESTAAQPTQAPQPTQSTNPPPLTIPPPYVGPSRTPTPLPVYGSTAACKAQHNESICYFPDKCTSDKNWQSVGDYGCSTVNSAFRCCTPLSKSPTPTPTLQKTVCEQSPRNGLCIPGSCSTLGNNYTQQSTSLGCNVKGSDFVCCVPKTPTPTPAKTVCEQSPRNGLCVPGSCSSIGENYTQQSTSLGCNAKGSDFVCCVANTPTPTPTPRSTVYIPLVQNVNCQNKTEVTASNNSLYAFSLVSDKIYNVVQVAGTTQKQTGVVTSCN